MANQSLTPWRRGSLASGGGLTGLGGSSLFDLHRQVNRLFDDILDRGSAGSGMQAWAGATGWPQLEIEQQENSIRVTAELPGVNEDDIELTIEDGILSLAGEKRSERKDENGYSERSYGRFERRIALPNDVAEQACQAEFNNGVLTVTLPRSAEKARGRRIPLGRTGEQGALEAHNDPGTAARQEAAQESGSQTTEGNAGQQA